MKNQNPALPATLYAITALLLAACFDPVGTAQKETGTATGRVIVTIAGEGELSGTETPASASSARTLLPEYGLLAYTVTIAKAGTTVFTQTITETSVAADLAAGDYTVSVTAEKSGNALVAQGSGTVTVSLGVESVVTIRLASVALGTGTLDYTVRLSLPRHVSFTGGSITLYSLSGGTNPSPLDLSGGLAGSQSLPAGFYRAVLAVEILGKRVAQTRILHIGDQTTSTAEFDLAIGDFLPLPPDGGSVIYITDQAGLEAIRDHIGAAAMNNGKNAYVLLNDIALSGTWEPIGIYRSSPNGSDYTTYNAFHGYFFGENHRITGLKLPDPVSYDSYYRSYTGLFGVLQDALVQDLTVETTTTARIMLNDTLYSNSSYANYNGYYIGFVAGQANNSDLSNITVKPGTITVETEHPSVDRLIFGGVAGSVSGSRLRNITVAGAPGSSLSFPLNVKILYIGGIAGSAGGEISESAAALDINMSGGANDRYTGGLAGDSSATIRQSFWSGAIAISGSSYRAYTGGIAGSSTGTIETCYASPLITISVAVTDTLRLYTGGIAGTLGDSSLGTIKNSYAACDIGISVTTVGRVKYLYSGGVAGLGGPLTGNNGGSVENCYAAGYLNMTLNGTPHAEDEVYTGGISGGFGSVSSSAALMETITGNAGSIGAYSRINPRASSLTNNIAFINMFVNGATLADAVTDPQHDANGLGKTAAQLASQASYAALGWDFAAVWKMGPAAYPYPVLQWQDGAVPVPPGFEPLTDEPFGAGIGYRLEEPISLEATAERIYKTGSPASLTITAPSGYDAYRWLVDGKIAGTAQSLSMDAANYVAGGHAVTAILYRGTIPYSKNIVITVSGE